MYHFKYYKVFSFTTLSHLTVLEPEWRCRKNCGDEQIHVQTLALPIISCVTLWQLRNLSEPWLLMGQMGKISKVLVRIKWTNICKVSRYISRSRVIL